MLELHKQEAGLVFKDFFLFQLTNGATCRYFVKLSDHVTLKGLLKLRSSQDCHYVPSESHVSIRYFSKLLSGRKRWNYCNNLIFIPIRRLENLDKHDLHYQYSEPNINSVINSRCNKQKTARRKKRKAYI